MVLVMVVYEGCVDVTWCYDHLISFKDNPPNGT